MLTDDHRSGTNEELVDEEPHAASTKLMTAKSPNSSGSMWAKNGLETSPTSSGMVRRMLQYHGSYSFVSYYCYLLFDIACRKDTEENVKEAQAFSS